MVQLRDIDIDYLEQLKAQREGRISSAQERIRSTPMPSLSPAVPAAPAAPVKIPAPDMWQISHPSQQVIPEQQKVVEQLKNIAKPPAVDMVTGAAPSAKELFAGDFLAPGGVDAIADRPVLSAKAQKARQIIAGERPSVRIAGSEKAGRELLGMLSGAGKGIAKGAEEFAYSIPRGLGKEFGLDYIAKAYSDLPPEALERMTPEQAEYLKRSVELLTKEPEGALEQVGEIGGRIIPYLSGVGGIKAVLAAPTKAILKKYAPKLATTALGKLIPGIVGTGAMGGAVSAVRQASKGIAAPDEFELGEALKEVGADVARFAAFAGAGGLVGKPVANTIGRGLTGAFKAGYVSPALYGGIVSASRGAATGATVAALETAIKYLRDPEEFDAVEAAGDMLTTALFFAGLDVLFSLNQITSGFTFGRQGFKMEPPVKQAADPYAELGLKPGTTLSEVKSAYRGLAKQYHPDVAPGNEEKFKRVALAYAEILRSIGPRAAAQEPAAKAEFAKLIAPTVGAEQIVFNKILEQGGTRQEAQQIVEHINEVFVKFGLEFNIGNVSRHFGDVLGITYSRTMGKAGKAKVSKAEESVVSPAETKPQTPEEIRKSMQEFQITQQTERERQAAEKEMQEVEEAKRQERERLEKSKGMEKRVAELMERERIPATLPELPIPAPGMAPAEEIPAKVPEVPEVSETRPVEVAPAKEPWEMTLAEYGQSFDPITQSEWGYYGIETSHYDHVYDALKKGKPVPPEVLKDYPELKAGEKPAPAGVPAPTTTDIAVGGIVYRPETGEPLTVINADDPSLLVVQNKRGTQFKIGRKTVDLESPKQAEPEAKAKTLKQKPKIVKTVYHGSGHSFDDFDMEKSSGMVWLTSNPKYAEIFADGTSVKKSKVSLTNPVNFKGWDGERRIGAWQKILKLEGVQTENIDWEKVDFAPEYGLYYFYDLLPHAGNNYRDAGVLDALKNAGYDGIIAPEETNEGVKSGKTYVAFYPDQVKSITEPTKASDLTKGETPKPEAEAEAPTATEVKPEPEELAPVSSGKTATAKTERGTAIEAKYAVVEADSLTASHDTNLRENPDYPKELQPRDRTRIASEAQINHIAQKLEPEFLGESPKVSEGAPVVGKDGIIESGNARTIALQRLYSQSHKNAERYKNWIMDNAGKFGIDKEAMEGVKSPVLVRIRQTDIDRVKFTQEANEQAVAAMSASEQAQADAKKLTGRLMAVFDPSESGEIVTAGNRRFISDFLSEVVSEAERGKYITKDGSISQEGVIRIRNVVFAKAYGDTGAIEKLAESTDVNVKNQINAMLIAAPRLIRLNEAVSKGELYDLNISQELAAAMNKLSGLREAGQTVDNYLRQISLVEDLSPLAKEVLYVFDKHKRSSKRIASILQAYADGVELAGNPNQQTIFKGEGAPGKEEVWARAVRKAEGLDEEALQTTIFQSQGMGDKGVGQAGEGASKEAPGGEKTEEELFFIEPEIKIAKATSRTRGVVGPKATVPRYVMENVPKDFKILDYGAGKDTAHVKTLLQAGFLHVEAHDFHNPNEAALQRKHDVTYASNVLNVQSSEEMLRETLEEIRDATKEGGKVYANYPVNPRKSSLTTGQVKNIIEEMLGPAKKIGGTTAAPLWEVTLTSREAEEAPGGEKIRPRAEQAFAGAAPKLKYKKSDSVEPVKRRDIINYLSTKLDVPIRIGRFTQKALGIFKVKPEVVRTRLANDIPVISHEVGHFLDKKLNLGDRAFDAELLALGERTSRPSYTKAQIRKEGVAEFMRLYLTSPNEAQKQAPKYYAAFENKMLANGDIHDVLLQARQDIKAWTDQPAKARILGSISVGEKKRRKMSFERLYTAAVDELRPLEKYVKDVAGEADIESNPFLIAWLGRGWTGKAETFLHHGIVDENFNKIGPSLDEVLKPVNKNLDDFRAYIIAKRARELHARDKRTGIEEADAKTTVKELETPEFKEALKSLVKYQDSVLNELVQSGVISKDAATTMRKLNQNYIPFYRVFEEEMGGNFGFGKGGFANIKSPVKRLRGSERDIIDPLESVIKNTFYMVNVAERNRVGRAIIEIAEGREGAGKWVEKLPTPMHGVRINLTEVKEALEAVGVDTEGIDLDKVTSVFRPSPFPAGKENILAVYRNGNKEYYQLEPELYRATLSLDKETSNLFINLLSLPAKTLRAGATLTPEFMARNPVRDIQQAMVMSKYGFNPTDFVKGLFHAFKKDDIYWKWKASGGAHGAMVSLDRDYLQGSLMDLLQTSAKDKAMNILKSPLEVLRALSEFGEQATRIGEFAKGLKYEPQTRAGIMNASLSSRDVTLDFGRVGYAGKIPNRVIAFFNAAVQGTDKMVREFRRNPGRSLLRSFLYITLPSIILYFMNRDDKRYQELPQWQKDTFWIIPTKKILFRIPKPFELGMIFGTFPERVLQYIDTQDPKAFDEYASRLAETVLPSAVPTALLGWIEAFTNKSFYTGRPIVPRSEESLYPELQYGDYTSETAKVLGNIFGFSPRKIDHMLRSYGGGLATYGTKTLDSLINIAIKEEKPEKPKATAADYPLVGAFVPRMWQSADSIDKFYKRLDEAEKAYKSANKRGYAAEEEKRKMVGLKKLRSVSRDLSKVRAAAQTICKDSKMSAEKKREELDRLNLLQINMARKALGREIIKEK